MPQEVKVWKVLEGDILKSIEKTGLNLEKRLENWLLKDISILSDDLIIIGHQVRGKIDLLSLDREGDAVIIELKRDRTPRDIVAQTLDYASWVKDLSNDEISEIAKDYLGSNGPLEEAFRRKFHEDLPETLNAGHKMLIVASEMDSSSERIVQYLSESYGVAINTASFQYFKDANGNEFLARVFLIDPKEVESASRASKRHNDDDIDKFMKSVRGKLSDHLASGLMPPKSSRWAGRDGSKRYFNYWYDAKPWHSTAFCFGTELETNEEGPDYGEVWVSFYVDKDYIINQNIPEKTTTALLQLMRKRDKQNGFKYFDEKACCDLGKGVPANNLSTDESDKIAKELAWLISNLTSEITDILITTQGGKNIRT
jgi:hypothetical protein